MSTFSKTAREVEMPNGDIVVLHNAVTENTTSNIKKFKYDDNGHVTESTAANATDLNLNSYSTPTTGSTAIGTSDAVQTAIGKLDHQSQIDQSNILYNLNMGVKNILPVLFESRTTYGVTCTNNGDGSITVNGTNSQSSGTIIIANVQSTVYDGYGDPRNFLGKNRNCVCIGNTTTANLRIQVLGWNSSSDNSIIASSTTDAVSFNTGNWNYISVRILVQGSATFNNVVIKPMICTDAAWNQSHDYQPPALPNYDLTRLESEDRAALAEEIDAGAKNLLDVLNRASVTTGGITCTFNSDGTITLNGTATGSPATYIYLYTTASGNNPWKAPNSGTYVMTCEGATTSDFCMYNDGDWGTNPLLNSEKTLTKGQSVPIIIRVVNGKVLNNVTVKPMICTKAAFGVSQKFTPYRVPITGLTAVNRSIACSTTETSTGIKFVSTKTAMYRITVTAHYGASKPLSLRIKQKINTSASQYPFVVVESTDNSIALTATGIMTLGVGGEFEIFTAYASAANNNIYMLVEELG